jgi:post-segregation antitoxin (ccd killing protein)
MLAKKSHKDTAEQAQRVARQRDSSDDLAWKVRNTKAIANMNKLVEEHGLLSDEWRAF